MCTANTKPSDCNSVFVMEKNSTNRLKNAKEKSKTSKRSRRNFLSASVAAGVTVTAGCMGNGNGDEGNPIKIGDLSPRTGTAAPYGIPKHTAAQLAVQEKNANGGLLGREIELIDPDPETNNQRYQELVQEMILEDQVDMIVGTVLGAAREAIRPILGENQQLGFYTQQYSGGICDQYMFSTGPDPDQQMGPMIPYMMDRFGDDVYIVAADYNFGRNSAAVAERLIQEEGGEVLDSEFIPLEVSDFSTTINRINSEDPDWIMHLLVGDAHMNFFTERLSADVNIPIASTLTFGLTYEHLVTEPPTMENVYSCIPWYQELSNDIESAQQFVSDMNQVRELDYVNNSSVNHYLAYQYYFEAVEEAETVEQEEVALALETGDMRVDAPYGESVRMDRTHSSTHHMRLATATEDHEIDFVQEFGEIEPEFIQQNCALGTDESSWDDPITEWIRG